MNGARGDKEDTATDTNKTETENVKKKPRLRSLDTFRG